MVERIVKKDVIHTTELPADIAKAMEKEEAKHRLVMLLYTCTCMKVSANLLCFVALAHQNSLRLKNTTKIKNK